MKLNPGLLALAGSMALMASGCNCGATHPPVVGGSCSPEGLQSDCAKDGLPYACAACQGHWLLCQNGKWISIHCDPMPNAGIDARDATDLSTDLNGHDAMDSVPGDARDALDVPAHLDGRMDTRPGGGRDSAASETAGSTSVQVEGGPCAVEGQRSDCAKDGTPADCGWCQGHWLLCQGGKWIPIHCDPPMPIVEPKPDAALAVGDAADGPRLGEVRGPVDTAPSE